jgi:hypothetical protein
MARDDTDFRIGTSTGFKEWIDRLLEKKLLPRLVRIVLKPYEPNPWRKLLNRFYAWKNDVRGAEDAIASSPEFAGMVRDFFLLNVAWIDWFMNTPLKSDLTPTEQDWEEMSPAQMLYILTNLSMQLATVTSPADALSVLSRRKTSSSGESSDSNGSKTTKTSSDSETQKTLHET